MSRTPRLIAVTATMLAAAAIAAGPAPADPHAQDAHERAVAAHQDLRSPDTRDAAEGRTAPVVVRVDRVSDTGLSWDSAGIGALVTAGLLTALAGAFLLVSRRRRPAVQAGIGSTASAP
jgi:hypothetical protein